MCVLNVLGRGLLIQEWEGVCCRVWSAGVRTEKEPREEEEGFYGVPGTPIAPRKVASCRGVRAPVWERSNSLLWLWPLTQPQDEGRDSASGFSPHPDPGSFPAPDVEHCVLWLLLVTEQYLLADCLGGKNCGLDLLFSLGVQLLFWG